MNEAIPIEGTKRSQLAEARQIISARELQKLAKNESPVFLVVVRVTNDSPNIQCANRGKRSQNRVAKFAAAHGRTEGQKRQINKQTGRKKDIIFVKERERQVLDSVPESHRKDLAKLIKGY